MGIPRRVLQYMRGNVSWILMRPLPAPATLCDDRDRERSELKSVLLPTYQRVCCYAMFSYPARRQHLISCTPFRSIFGFDQLEQRVALTCICTTQSPGQRWAKIRSQVPELDQWQHLRFTSLELWRICSTWEMGYMSFASWELPHLLSQYNSHSPSVCGYYLSV